MSTAIEIQTTVEPSPAQLLQLGSIVADLQLRICLPKNKREPHDCRALLAGIAVTLQHLLPPAQFRSVLIQWELDATELYTLFDLKSSSPLSLSPGFSQVQPAPSEAPSPEGEERASSQPPEDEADRLVREHLESLGLL